MLSDTARLMIQMAIVPLVWMLLSKFSRGPATRFLCRHLSHKIARAITKQIWERK